MASRKPGIICSSDQGKDWIDSGTMCRSRTGSPGIMGMVMSLVIGAAPKDAQSDDAAFKTAVDLFRETPISTTENGKRVLAKLDMALKVLKVSYGPDNSSNAGSGTIQIEASNRGDIPNTSVCLVHEAFHLAIHLDLYIDDEIASRDIQAEYGQYLVDHAVSVGGQTYQLKNPPHLNEVKGKDQVVDYVINMYFGVESNFTITKEWIMAHKDEWKGLCNRTTKTRKIYAKILVDSQPTGGLNPFSIDPDVAAALFELLECAPMDSKAILSHAGESDAMKVLGKLPASYSSRYAAWQKMLNFSGPTPIKEFKPPSR